MLHGADASLHNGQGLSTSDIINAVKAANAAFSSVSTSEESSETGSIILETNVLDYFGFQGDKDQGSREEDVEDDSLTAVDRSWDSSEYTPKLDPDANDYNSTTASEYTSPQLYRMSFDNDNAPPTRTYRETCAIPPLNHMYLSESIDSSQTHGILGHDHPDLFDPELFLGESSDEDELYSTSLLYKIHQLRSPASNRPSSLCSVMRHGRRFGFPSTTYFDYLSTLGVIPRSPARSDCARKIVRWEEVKEIIVFRRHLHESTEPESGEEAEEEEVAAFRRAWVYQEHGLEPAYFQDECESPNDTICRKSLFEASNTSVEEDEEDDRSSKSVSSGNNFYGLSQINASTNDLPAQGAFSAKAPVLDRPLPRIPVWQESQASTFLPTGKRRNSLQRRTPPPPKLSLDTQEQKSANLVLVWQPQPESGIAFSVTQDPRMPTVLKSPPPQSFPKSLLANASPMLARILRKFPEGSHPSPCTRVRNDALHTTPRQTSESDNKEELLTTPRPLSSLCRSRSETNLPQHISDTTSMSSSAIDLGCFEKELPVHSGTWSKGARVISALKTSLKFLSPPPSPSSITSSPSSLSLTATWLPRQCSRSDRPMSLVLSRPLIFIPALSQVLGKTVTSSEDIGAKSNQTGVDSSMAQLVPKGTLPSVKTTSRNAIDLLPPPMASRLRRSDSDRARSPQVYPHQQSEEPTTTVTSSNSSFAQEKTSLDPIVYQSFVSRQSNTSDNRSNKNHDWDDRKAEVPQYSFPQPVLRDLQDSGPTTISHIGAAVSQPKVRYTPVFCRSSVMDGKLL